MGDHRGSAGSRHYHHHHRHRHRALRSPLAKRTAKDLGWIVAVLTTIDNPLEAVIIIFFIMATILWREDSN